jgi:hypothetical protein
VADVKTPSFAAFALVTAALATLLLTCGTINIQLESVTEIHLESIVSILVMKKKFKENTVDFYHRP